MKKQAKEIEKMQKKKEHLKLWELVELKQWYNVADTST